MREVWIKKGIAAGIAIGFLALVQTQEHPPLWIMAFLAIGFYECNLAAVREIWRLRKIKKEVDNNLLGRYSLDKWAEQSFRWPMKEVK